MVLIRSLTLVVASLATSMAYRCLAFVAVLKVPLVGGGRTIHRLDTGNLILNMVSEPEPVDTVRVRIWKALAASPGKEMTLKELGAQVGERRTGELKDHLKHVTKQSETLRNKSSEWKERRGLPTVDTKRTDKLRIRIRKGKKNEIYVQLA